MIIKQARLLNLKDDGVYINAKLAEILDLKVGDQLTLSLDNKDYKVKLQVFISFILDIIFICLQNTMKTLTKDEVHYNSQYFKLNKKQVKRNLQIIVIIMKILLLFNMSVVFQKDSIVKWKV